MFFFLPKEWHMVRNGVLSIIIVALIVEASRTVSSIISCDLLIVN